MSDGFLFNDRAELIFTKDHSFAKTSGIGLHRHLMGHVLQTLFSAREAAMEPKDVRQKSTKIIFFILALKEVDDLILFALGAKRRPVGCALKKRAGAVKDLVGHN